MIQHAFKNAEKDFVQSVTQYSNTLSSGIKDVATLALGITGFAGGLGNGAVAKGAEHALAGRIGGVGGNIMLATLQQKKDTAKAKEATNDLFSAEQVNETIQAQLGDNPINRAAKKSLGTVFETLVNARNEEIINKKGNIESSIGEIDPNSELGKKILKNVR